MNSYSLLVYSVRNLGDMIQTLALSQHFPPAAGTYRHRMQAADPDRLLVVNGVLYQDAPPATGPRCLFAGVSGPYYRHKEYLAWLARSAYPIGARDQDSERQLRAAGLATTLTGCATLTLPRYNGPRSGAVSADYPGPGEFVTHRISRRDAVETQWRQAVKILEKYRKAEAVYTSRLHVALPCLAMGTPVWIARPDRRTWRSSRFDLLVDALGVPFQKMTTCDVSPWAQRFKEFLERNLGHRLDSGEPKMPLPPPRRWWPEWLRR